MSALDSMIGYIKRMNEALLNARAQWSSFDASVGDWFSGGSIQNEALGAIENINQTSCKPWKDAALQVDTTNQGALDKWIGWGNEITDALNKEAGYSVNTQFTTIVADSVAATGDDIKRDAEAVKNAVFDYTPWIVGGVIFVVLLALYLRVRG